MLFKCKQMLTGGGGKHILSLTIIILFLSTLVLIYKYLSLIRLHNETASTTIENTYGHNVFERSIISLNDSIDVLFFGDSMIYYGKWENVFHQKICVFGNCGMRIDQMYDRAKYIKHYNPKTIVVWCGTNGAYTNFENMSLEEFQDCYSKLLSIITIDNPCSKIYCMSILPQTDNKKPLDKIHKCNEVISNVCSRHDACIVPIPQNITNKKGYLQNNYSDDGLHLNSKGYSKIYKKIGDFCF